MARYLKIAKETTYGTPVAGAYTIPAIDPKLQLDHGYVRSPTLEARWLTRSVGGPKKVSGGWSQYVNYKNIGLLLKALCGDETVVTDEVGVRFTHTFKLNALGSLPSLTVRVGQHDVNESIFEGCALDSLNLENVPDDYLKASFDVVGEDESTGAVDAAPVFNSQAYATITNTFTLGGTAARPEKLTLNFKNNLKSDHHDVTSRLMPRVEPGDLVEITGEMDIRFLTTTHLTDFLNSTRRALVAKWQGPALGTDFYHLQVTIDSIEYDAGDVEVNTQERLVQGLEFTGVKVGADLLAITLRNDESAAY